MKSIKPLYIYFVLLFGFIPFIYAIDEEKDFVYDLSLATQGVTVSQYNTGVNYYIGRGIDKDLEKAVYWYQMASEEGHSKAPFNIAIIYANGEVPDKDFALALEYFLLSAERGNKEAKQFIKLLKRHGSSSLEESLAEICCPEPLSHSMVSKN
ncbi:MAG: tetratricopeptide repeat protein [Gammaproteobacteria bacterium]